MTEEKPKLGDEMKKQIEGAAKEHEKIVEGRAEFDSKKPNLFKEIEAKANEHQKVLEGKGKITHEEAIEKAEKEFNIYREREMKELVSDFDIMMKSLPNNIETINN